MEKITDIKVGYTCNNDCIHCVIAQNRDNLIHHKQPINRDFDECKKEILEAIENRAEKIILTGGEPTIRKDFLELLALINTHSLSINIQTNGRTFKDFEFAREVASSPKISFSVALHGPEEIHDTITRRKGSFNETVKGIKNLVELNKFISIKFVISKLNYKFIAEMVDLMSNLKLKHINLTFPHGIGNAGENFFDIVPRYSEIIPFLRDAFDYCTQKGIWFETETIPYCFLEGYEERSSESFLKTLLMETRPVGRDTLNWSEKRQEIKRKGEQCHNCLFFEICEGPWEEYGENYGFNELIPIEANVRNMMTILVKHKIIKEFKSGKQKIVKQDINVECNR